MVGIPESVAIVGAGQAGSALAHGFRRAGLRVTTITSRTTEAAAALAAAVDADPGDLEACTGAELVCICTPDHAVAEVAGALADLDAAQPGACFLHTSGALDLEVLDPLSARGAAAGNLHPVAPLVPPEDPATLEGKPMGFDAAGDPGWVETLVRLLGGRPVSLVGVDRALYHAGCVTAANLVVGLAGAAAEMFSASGVDPASAHELVSSLLTASARNVATDGVAQALTGPVRRGDAATVARHLATLEGMDSGLAETYRVVSARLVDLMEPGAARDRSARVLGGGERR